LNCPSVTPVFGKITYYVGTAPRQLEAEDYAHELMDVFNGCHLSAAYGYDPFPNYIIVNDKKVIVAPEENFLLRVQGIELWVLDPKHPPVAAKQMADALTSAGISFDWKPDIRLAGIAAYDRYRIRVESPQCILFVGSKPPWSWHSFLWIERKSFAFRSQHPPDANEIMYRALVVYGLLIFSAPLALVLLWVAESRTLKLPFLRFPKVAVEKIMSTPTTTLRHAAALALVGWYLITPPLGPDGRPDRQAPLSHWSLHSSYDTARECQKGWVAAIRLSKGAPEWYVEQSDLAKCFPTEDPRLKGK
jgi:hypothetical protein